MRSEQRAFITIYDGTYRYTYDPWSRLVKTTLDDTNITVQTAKYDGQGRRVTERAREGSVMVVTNSGDLDGTVRYYYNKNQIIETLDGAGKLINQVYHAERARGGSVKEYIDEIVAMRTEFGRAYVHLAEGDQGGSLKDWNVIGLTDITGRSLERYYYSPYGELEAVRDAHFFDYDDDGDVDSADNTALTACIGETIGDCLRFDADADGTITQDDADAFSSYTATLTSNTELQRIPTTTSGSLGNPFGHQGLAFDAEIGSYQNRARQYAPKMKRFMQRDPLELSPKKRGKVYIDDGRGIYQYVRLNPMGLLDPSGLAACDWAWGGPPFTGSCIDKVGDACTSCDGNGNPVVCLDPFEFDNPNLLDGGCDSNASDIIERCTCQHESSHLQDLTNGNNGCKQKGGTSICAGARPGKSKRPCNPCCSEKSEVDAYQKEIECYQAEEPLPIMSEEREMLDDALRRLEVKKQEAKQCEEDKCSDC